MHSASALLELVQIANREDEHVIDEVHDDGGDQSEGEHQVEEIHPDEPRVDQTEQSLVFVTVAEARVGDDQPRRDVPGAGVSEHALEQSHGEEVGHGQNERGLKPPDEAMFEDEAAEDVVDSLGHGDGPHEQKPAEDDFFHDARSQAEPETAGIEGFGVVVFAAAIERQRRNQSGPADCPDENRPGSPEPLDRGAGGVPQLEEAVGNGCREKPVDQSDQGRHFGCHEKPDQPVCLDLFFVRGEDAEVFAHA